MPLGSQNLSWETLVPGPVDDALHSRLPSPVDMDTPSTNWNEEVPKGDDAILHLAAGVLRKGVELTVEKLRKLNFVGIMREILTSGEFRKGPKNSDVKQLSGPQGIKRGSMKGEIFFEWMYLQ